jgi:NAD(P)-dependent dehydrogenase (short-subunit alcohol dehydrogenase family)
VKALDVDPAADPALLAAALLEELERGGAGVEAGRRGAERRVPAVVRRPLDAAAPSRFAVDAGTTALLAGGGRGVTAAIAVELARRAPLRLALWGSRPIPAGSDQVAAMDADELAELRRTLARERRERTPGVTPYEADAEYRELVRGAEVERTLRELRELGAQATYEAVDVRDAAAVERAVAALVAERGAVDLVVLGAGVIADRLLEDKEPASFERVFDVKAAGAANVLRALEARRPRAVVGMTSVAGRFGNPGQADYAAGNDLLARHLAEVGRAWPGTRVVAVDWTAFSEAGLAARTGATELLAGRGIVPLTPADGARRLLAELERGDGSEVVVAGGLEALDGDGTIAGGPFDRTLGHEPGRRVVLERTFSLERDRWLEDHVIGGSCLLPGVVAIELLAQAAALLAPGGRVAALEDVELERAVTVRPGKPATLRVVAEALDAGEPPAAVRAWIESDVRTPDGTLLVEGRVHVRGTARLGPEPAPPPAEAHARAGEAPAVTLYGPGGLLPHGPAFQALGSLDRVGDDGGDGTVATGNGAPLLGGAALTAPLPREAAFQVAGLHGILRHGALAIPRGCRRIELFGAPPAGTPLVARATLREAGGDELVYDVELVGSDGRVYDRMRGYRAARLDGVA